MTAQSITRYIRPIEDVRADMLAKARVPIHPWPAGIQADEVERIFASIHTLDRDEWAEAFSAVARPYEAQGLQAEAAGNAEAAQQNYQRAYAYYRMARYPAPNSPGKRNAYDKSVELYFKTAKYLDPPMERVVMPFQGRPGEGDAVIGYLRRPKVDGPVPVVVRWGGIDTFKEEWSAAPFLTRNLAMIAVDMPGVGQAPIPGSEDAERMYDAIFDWIATRPELDASRVGIVGGST